MLRNKKLIRIRLRFAAAEREVECGFSPQCTLKENLDMITGLLSDEPGMNSINMHEMIISDLSSFIYDMNVSVSSYGIAEGTCLIVY